MKGRNPKNEIANAIRESAIIFRDGQRSKDSQQENENRRVIANSLMAWANLVFVGLVIAQAFSSQFNPLIAITGGISFLLAYYVASRIMKGGERK